MVELISQPLEVLNAQSAKNAYSLEDFDLSRPIDKTLKWMPESVLYLRFLPSYSKLTPQQKLRYNQIYALAICEQFIWFERDTVIPIMETLLSKKMVPDLLRTCLEHFIEDEIKHTEMFKKLMYKAAPELEEKKSYHFLNYSMAQNLFFKSVIKQPDLFLVWIWMTIYFEERTMYISRKYVAEKREKGIVAIDPTFARAHHLHMLDEARHLQIDQYLLSYLYDHQPQWKKSFAAMTHTKVLRAYTMPNRMGTRILNMMKAEFPYQSALFDQLIAELPTLGTNKDFIHAQFGDDAIERNRILLGSYPEMSKALEVIS